MTTRAQQVTLTAETFESEVLREHLAPLWRISQPVEPITPAVPCLWRWEQVRNRMVQAGSVIPVGGSGAERRALMMRNPGKTIAGGTTNTLIAGVQMVLPGEVAPAHRHTMSAIRFIIEGSRAYTVVNGEPCTMEPGDLILTPNWTWHGHVNEGDEPMFWLDGLDVPLVISLGSVFYEDYPEDRQPLIRGRDESLHKFGAGALRPTWERSTSSHSPLMSYKWAQSRETLAGLASMDGSPFDGVALTFTNPFSGGPVLPTMACWIQMLRPGERTRAHRHTASAVYHVVQGRGYSIIAGERFDWAEHDTFALPTWAWHEHANATDQEAVLFSIQDTPVLQALDLYREQEHPEGHQQG